MNFTRKTTTGKGSYKLIIVFTETLYLFSIFLTSEARSFTRLFTVSTFFATHSRIWADPTRCSSLFSIAEKLQPTSLS
ncbi:hypothetical protein Hanom_Chr15g01358451 [Helianthus anomalus]